MSLSKPALHLPLSLPDKDNVAHALAGAGGGVLAMVMTYPLITLSTRAQVESTRAHSAFLAAVQRIVAREGVSGLYAGLSSALFGIGVTNFIYYYWYEWTRAAFDAAAAANSHRAATRRRGALESMVAGAIAGSAVVVLTNPIWVINTRMTTRAHAGADDKDVDAAKKSKAKTKPPSTLATLLNLVRDEGSLALWAGVMPALVLVINPILQYTLFEQMKKAVERRRRVTPAVAFVLGALGKLVATAVTYPYMTVKSQMHVASDAGKGKREGTVQALRRLFQAEGYAGLYRGIGPKLTQSVATAAFLFAFKDLLYAYTLRLRSRAARNPVGA